MMSQSFYLSIVTRDNILINGKIYEKREMVKQESVMLLNKLNLVSQQCIALLRYNLVRITGIQNLMPHSRHLLFNFRVGCKNFTPIY